MSSFGEELERLAALRASGDLTEEEYETLKQRLIDEPVSGESPESSRADSISPRRRSKAVVLGVLGILVIIGVVLVTQLGDGSSDDGLSSVEQAWVDSKTAEIGDGPYGLGQEEASCALATLVEENGLDEARYQFDLDLPTREFARSFASAFVGCVDVAKLISTLFFEDPDLEDLPIEFLDCIMKLVLEGDVVTDLFVVGLMEDPDSEVDRIMGPLLPELLVCMGESLSAEEIADLLPTTETNEDEVGSTDDPQMWPAKIVFGFVPSQEQEQLQLAQALLLRLAEIVL